MLCSFWPLKKFNSFSRTLANRIFWVTTAPTKPQQRAGCVFSQFCHYPRRGRRLKTSNPFPSSHSGMGFCPIVAIIGARWDDPRMISMKLWNVGRQREGRNPPSGVLRIASCWWAHGNDHHNPGNILPALWGEWISCGRNVFASTGGATPHTGAAKSIATILPWHVFSLHIRLALSLCGQSAITR